MFGTKCLGGRRERPARPQVTPGRAGRGRPPARTPGAAAPRAPVPPAPRPLPVHYIQVQVVGAAVQHAAALGAQRRQVAVEDGGTDPAPRRHRRRRPAPAPPRGTPGPPQGARHRPAPPPSCPARGGRRGWPRGVGARAAARGKWRGSSRASGHRGAARPRRGLRGAPAAVSRGPSLGGRRKGRAGLSPRLRPERGPLWRPGGQSPSEQPPARGGPKLTGGGGGTKPKAAFYRLFFFKLPARPVLLPLKHPSRQQCLGQAQGTHLPTLSPCPGRGRQVPVGHGLEAGG